MSTIRVDEVGGDVCESLHHLEKLFRSLDNGKGEGVWTIGAIASSCSGKVPEVGVGGWGGMRGAGSHGVSGDDRRQKELWRRGCDVEGILKLCIWEMLSE